MWTVAAGLAKPDDLLFSNGSLYVALLGSGAIELISPGQSTLTLPVRIPVVEGMAIIGRRFYAAGQQQDAVYEVSGSELRTVIQLSPVPGQDGVDGIAVQDGRLIVPDSPRGVVDWVDPGTGALTRQVGGFVRPTGAWPLPDGSVVIADEYGNAAVKVAPDGTKSFLVRRLPIVDDVAADSQGAVFAVTPVITGGRLVQLVGGGAVRDLADRLLAPQGLAVDGADNLYLSEEDGGRVDLLIRTFKLVPLQTVADSSTQPVCVDVARAAGFNDPVSLDAGPGMEVVQQPGTGSTGAILVTGCRQAPCVLMARSGNRIDRLWVNAQAA